MKRFLTCLMIFTLLSSLLPAFAMDDGFWDEPIKIDEAAKSQQKAVTDQEFNKVLDFFNYKKKKKEAKKKPKGAPIGPQLQEGQVPQIDGNVVKTTYEDYPTVMIPVTLIAPDGVEIMPGYYRILSVKRENGLFFLNFYQGNSIIAKVRAFETGNDHNQKSLNYAKVIPVDDKYMNVIYGDIDCNIEARIDIKK